MASLTTGAPLSTTGSSATQSGMPDWYSELIRSIASQGMGAVNASNPNYTGARTAGMAPAQLSGLQALMQALTTGQGAVTQGITSANNAGKTAQGGLGFLQQYGLGALGSATGAAGAANSAVSGPLSMWTDSYQKYMNPYMSSVTDEIARLGNRNFTENIMPGIQGANISAGQFGSTRNAAALGDAARDVQRDITGAQSTALQQGYGQAADIFGQDMNRWMTNNMNRANVALQGGQLMANTGLDFGKSYGDLALGVGGLGGNLAQILGGLGQTQQNMGLNAGKALMDAGGVQQATQQKGLDTAYQDWMTGQNWDMTQLGGLAQLLKGLQLPTNTTTAQSDPNGYGTSPLGWLASLLGMNMG